MRPVCATPPHVQEPYPASARLVDPPDMDPDMDAGGWKHAGALVTEGVAVIVGVAVVVGMFEDVPEGVRDAGGVRDAVGLGDEVAMALRETGVPVLVPL